MTRSEFLEDRYCGDCEVDCEGVSGETADGGACDPRARWVWGLWGVSGKTADGGACDPRARWGWGLWGVSGKTADGGACDPERGGGGDCEGSQARQRTGAPVTPSGVGPVPASSWTSKSSTSSFVSSVPLRLPTAQTSFVFVQRMRHTTPPELPLSSATRLRTNSPLRTSQILTVPSSLDVITNFWLNWRHVTALWCLLLPAMSTHLTF